jgi:hypothetical protein
MVLAAPMLVMKAADDLCTGNEVTSARHTLSAGKPSHELAGVGLALAMGLTCADGDAPTDSGGPAEPAGSADHCGSSVAHPVRTRVSTRAALTPTARSTQ